MQLNTTGHASAIQTTSKTASSLSAPPRFHRVQTLQRRIPFLHLPSQAASSMKSFAYLTWLQSPRLLGIILLINQVRSCGARNRVHQLQPLSLSLSHGLESITTRPKESFTHDAVAWLGKPSSLPGVQCFLFPRMGACLDNHRLLDHMSNADCESHTLPACPFEGHTAHSEPVFNVVPEFAPP